MIEMPLFAMCVLLLGSALAGALLLDLVLLYSAHRGHQTTYAPACYRCGGRVDRRFRKPTACIDCHLEEAERLCENASESQSTTETLLQDVKIALQKAQDLNDRAEAQQRAN